MCVFNDDMARFLRAKADNIVRSFLLKDDMWSKIYLLEYSTS